MKGNSVVMDKGAMHAQGGHQQKSILSPSSYHLTPSSSLRTNFSRQEQIQKTFFNLYLTFDIINNALLVISNSISLVSRPLPLCFSSPCHCPLLLCLPFRCGNFPNSNPSSLLVSLCTLSLMTSSSLMAPLPAC